jgi:hypothetical protein
MRQEIEHFVQDIILRIGIDRPSNMDVIVDFCMQDVIDTADKDNWHSGDVLIAFRRFLESKSI